VICDSALLLGYSRQQQVIGGDIIREAAGELRLAAREPEPATTPPGADPKSGRARRLQRFRLFR
jgi:hypothetical protein